MALTAEEVAELLKREGSAAEAHQDVPSTAEESRKQRTELLAPLLASLRESWTEKSSEMSLIAEKLGDGARDVAWRAPFGDSGILAFFIGVLASGELPQALQVQILRLIGNSCADTDENRNRIVEGKHFPLLIDQLKNSQLIPFAVPVLYNIMVDYEPAQLSASQSHCSQQLMRILSSPDITKYTPFVPFICKILALLITQEGEPALADPETVDILLSLALSEPASSDIEDFSTLVSVALSYLANEAFQARMVAEPHIELFLRTFQHAHANLNLPQKDADDDQDDAAEDLKKLRASLLVSLCDVTGRDEFAALHYPSSHRQSEAIGTFISWLGSSNAQLQTAACYALGNVSRSDEVSSSLVHTRAHEPLVRLLADTAVSDAQLLHSAISFIKNLAVPAQNKPLLTDLLEPSRLPRIMGLDTSPQVQFAAVSLTRLLLVNCPANVAEICRRPQGDSVDGIVALYKRSDAEPTKLEAARALAAICRVLHTPPGPGADPAPQAGSDVKEQLRVQDFYEKHGDITGPLAFLITQAKWPILHSETWFVFALMSRSRAGAAAVAQILAVDGTTEVLHRAVTGREMAAREAEGGAGAAGVKQTEEAGEHGSEADQVSAMMGGMELEPKQVDPKQKDSMARVDRENALVMCTELLRTRGRGDGGADEGLGALLLGLVKEGTQIIAAQRA